MEYALDKKLQGFQLIAQEKLQAVICSIPGKKDLILEQTLIKPLEHICAASWLKLKGIQHIYKFDVESAIPTSQHDNVQVFMMHSSHLEIYRRILRHVHKQNEESPTEMHVGIKHFHVICIPNCFNYFHCLLEEEGLYGLVQLHRYNWDFIYLDQGVLSMEVPNVFSNVFLRQDTSLLPSIAHTLRVLHVICGRPELILTFGDHSANIVKMLNSLNSWRKTKTPATVGVAEVPVLLIIDRDKDYASSLLTPAIYAGLLLEVFQNSAGEIEIEAESNKIRRQKLQIFELPRSKPPTTAKTQTPTDKSAKPHVVKSPSIRLNGSCDEIYQENRYKHFAQASSTVRAQAKSIGLEMQKLNEMKLEEMHDYVARKLPKITEHKSKVLRHLNASEKVIEMLGGNYRKVQTLEEDILNNVSRKRILTDIDEMLTTNGQRYNTLRLMCLLHLCSGISDDELAQFIRNYCNYFGAQQLAVFQRLSRAGLLPACSESEEKLNKSAKILSSLPIPKFQQTEFQANANRLRLLVSTAGAEASNVNANNSINSSTNSANTCASYVFNNLYIPLAAQLCAFLLKSMSADDFASKLPMVDKLQLHCVARKSNTSLEYAAYNMKNFTNAVKQAQLKDPLPLRKRNIFVFLLGGVTYAEIGACDLIARQLDAQITVASDNIISGADLIAGAFT